MGAADEGSPRLSVVIPAHNEGQVIARCLASLLDGGTPLEIIVVCNGCSDDTADRAAAFEQITVISIPEPSKVAALNAGDEAATAFPRFYVDADIRISGRDLMALAQPLVDGSALLVGPGLDYDTSRSSAAVRAYYRLWTKLPSVRDDVVGRGVYGVSREGRAQFDRFPEVVADDHWIRDHFAPSERVVVSQVTSIVDAPRTLGGLLARKVRVYSSNAALDGRTADARRRAMERQRQWLRVVRDEPRLLAALPVYLLVALVPRVVGGYRRRTGRATTWGRDETTRTPPGSTARRSR